MSVIAAHVNRLVPTQLEVIAVVVKMDIHKVEITVKACNLIGVYILQIC